MGMDAELIAIGKFSGKIVEHLDYPKDFYNDVPEGTEIITIVCNSVNTDQSKMLARSLGIEAWDFTQHCDIDVSTFKVDIGIMFDSVENEEQVQHFLVLRDAGFKFYYRPKWVV